MIIRIRRPLAGWRARAASFVACVAALLAAQATAAEFTIAAPPAWVQPVPLESPGAIPTEQLSQGVYYLLSDTQARIEANDRVSYHHLATKAVSQSGLESVAHVQIGFDPAYQALTLHSIRVHRDGQATSRLTAAAVRILQQEKELEYRIFDGSKSAHVFLEDVRVGDVVEYAYSVRGANPVFANRHFGRLDMQWNAPVRHMVSRLQWPTGRRIALAARGDVPVPATSEHDGYTEQRWERRDLPALMVDADAPAWYDPYPSVYWSEFADWGAVARWAAPLYRTPAALSPALQAEVRRIAAASPDPQARLLETLRFVQREIRYLGVEIGTGSHAPSAPATVLERRFGDCKDKSLLTVTLLAALGIEARAALVHTTLRGHVAALQPMPGVFNHVVVRARLEGKDFWLDPTRAPQPGSLDTLVQPPFERALVIDPATTALSAMAAAPVVYREVRMLVDARKGVDQPAGFTLLTRTQGAHAESLRESLAAQSRDDLQKRYLNYYARYYPDISVSRPMKVADDELRNRVDLTEQYSVGGFWSRAEDRKRFEGSVFSPDMEEALRGPRQVRRTAPLSLGPPAEFVYRTEVWLPEDWPVTPQHVVVQDPAFDFEHTVESGSERRVLVTERLTWHVEHIEAADTARYAANLERARNSLGASFYKNDVPAASSTPTRPSFNWLVAVVAAMMVAGWCWVARLLYRHDPEPPPRPVSGTAAGIGGWLLLAALAVVVNPLRLLADFAHALPAYSLERWTALTTPDGAAFDPMWAPILLFELFTSVGMLVGHALLAWLFFRKRSSTPRLFIAVVVLTWLTRLTDLLLLGTLANGSYHATDKDWRQLGGQTVGILLWTLYFMRSQRVAATFVRRLGPTMPPSPRAEPVIA